MKTKLKKIDPSTLYLLIDDGGYYVEDSKHDIHNWEVIKKELTSADDEDGGGHYDLILKHIPTGNLYKTSYSDWDMDNTDFDHDEFKVNGRCDLNCNLTSVVPVTETVIKYKTNK